MIGVGVILRGLVNNGLTTVEEMEEISGKSASTIYRWMNEESEPQYSDMRRLFRGLRPEARHSLIAQLSVDLPIVVNWLDDPEVVGEIDPNSVDAGHEVAEKTLLALDCVTHLLSEQHEAIRQGRLTEDAYTSLMRLLKEAIQYLAASRILLERYKPE